MSAKSIQETLAQAWEENPEQLNALMAIVNLAYEKSKDIATNTVNPRHAKAISLNPDIDKGRNL